MRRIRGDRLGAMQNTCLGDCHARDLERLVYPLVEVPRVSTIIQVRCGIETKAGCAEPPWPYGFLAAQPVTVPEPASAYVWDDYPPLIGRVAFLHKNSGSSCAVKLLITSGAGFIGSAVVRHVISQTHDSVVNVDKLVPVLKR